MAKTQKQILDLIGKKKTSYVTSGGSFFIDDTTSAHEVRMRIRAAAGRTLQTWSKMYPDHNIEFSTITKTDIAKTPKKKNFIEKKITATLGSKKLLSFGMAKPDLMGETGRCMVLLMFKAKVSEW